MFFGKSSFCVNLVFPLCMSFVFLLGCVMCVALLCGLCFESKLAWTFSLMIKHFSFSHTLQVFFKPYGVLDSLLTFLTLWRLQQCFQIFELMKKFEFRIFLATKFEIRIEFELFEKDNNIQCKAQCFSVYTMKNQFFRKHIFM